MIFGLIVVSLVLIITLKYLYSSKLGLPPGPFSWPVVGNLFQLGEKGLPHIALAKLAQCHGPDLMSMWFGSQLMVVASSPAAAAEVLKTHDRILAGRFVSRPLRIKGSLLHNLSPAFLEECDDYYRSIRAMLRTELFSGKALESQVSMREEKVMELIQCLSQKQGQVIKIKDLFFVTALNIMGNLFFSMDLIDFEGKGPGEGFKNYMNEYIDVSAIPKLVDLYPILGWDFQGTYKKIICIFHKISAVWEGIVQDKRSNRDSQLPSLGAAKDFTDVLLKNGYTDIQINALLVELFGAGTGTSVDTSEWMLVEILRNRQVLQKVQDEIAQVVGAKGFVKESDLPNLPYLDACFKETLRLHPPGPLLLPHRAVQACEIMGYRIPKDTQTLVNTWAVARDPKFWDDPLSFDPERFINSKVNYMGQHFEYIPFSSGRRICPGQPLASKVVPFVVASLIHTFDWSLPNDMDLAQINMEEIVIITMLKKEPLLVIPKLRKM
ncbi:PREDICTED: probable (S)-N-methylcoclaurine 3'-hydroxylase isozyme 2 [Nicotiana attenuata]|uniref:Cytochrome p450 76c2 n=1 Tax=Nicotiana attenuata TaxID=49451 RepID=A0A314KKV1_NICAT|nr:PREDICTED: probable (S)-N-methylcoclaurine 3'-hydroxylase isozyme 2 [Nicotiana attenuata]OIT29913.1 cytochrome p450 76c2 [Nicotiana attenuata]